MKTYPTGPALTSVSYCSIQAQVTNAHQHPVLDRGGSRAFDAAVTFVDPSKRLGAELVDEQRSSFGAIVGSRAVGFFEESPRFIPCITKVVPVMGKGYN